MQTIQNYIEQPSRPHRSLRRSNKTIVVIGAVLALAVLGTFVVMQQIKIQTSGIAALEEARNIRSQVARIMLLPEEDAMVSDIDNADNVRAQAFFSNVENGDKVLVFAQAAKIVIYRPGTNQIVNAGPIIDDGQTVTSQQE